MNFQWISGVIICCVILGQLIAGDVLYALTSGNVTINPQFKGDLKEILWKHDGHKAVEWDSTEHFQHFREFKGRTELNTETGQITINNLTDQHSGTYEAEGVVDGQMKIFKQNIEVLDPVQPKISCELNNTIATLSCRARGPQVKYKWLGPGQEEATWSQEERGPSFSSHSSGSDNYTCVARNPVSEKTQSFYTKDCPPLELSRETYVNVVTGVFVGVVGLVGLLIGMIIYKRKGKGIKQCGERGRSILDHQDVAALQPGENGRVWTEADSLIPGPGGNVAERNQEPFGKEFQSMPSKIHDVKDVNKVNLNSEEVRTIEAEHVDRQMLLEQKTGTQNSNVTQALQFSPGGQPPPKPPRKPGSIRGPCPTLVRDKQSVPCPTLVGDKQSVPCPTLVGDKQSVPCPTLVGDKQSVPCPTLVGDKQSDINTGNYAKQSYQESPVWFPDTRGAGEDEVEKREMSIEEGGLDYEEVGKDEVEKREMSIEEGGLDYEVGEDEGEKREMSNEKGGLDYEVGEDEGEKREMSNEKGGLDYEEGGMDREEGGKVYGEDEEHKKGVHEEGNKEKGDEEEVRKQDTGGFEIEREEKVESCQGGTECEDKREGQLPELRPNEQRTDAEASTHCGTGKTTNPSENGSQRQSCHKSSPPPSNLRSPPPVPPKPSVRHNARPT
ncbi:proline-, glutamic acid- and leucine-rich protein 1-like isoform X1 [Osmerus mordax]|uniref:proline-, glutamic acid- and leucine-rich protein 1-like isoform X1 n=1 Tax=Osmerus mordax TaxID=8014 RepID=UPI00350EF388